MAQQSVVVDEQASVFQAAVGAPLAFADARGAAAVVPDTGLGPRFSSTSTRPAEAADHGGLGHQAAVAQPKSAAQPPAGLGLQGNGARMQVVMPDEGKEDAEDMEGYTCANPFEGGSVAALGYWFSQLGLSGAPSPAATDTDAGEVASNADSVNPGSKWQATLLRGLSSMFQQDPQAPEEHGFGGTIARAAMQGYRWEVDGVPPAGTTSPPSLKKSVSWSHSSNPTGDWTPQQPASSMRQDSSPIRRSHTVDADGTPSSPSRAHRHEWTTQAPPRKFSSKREFLENARRHEAAPCPPSSRRSTPGRLLFEGIRMVPEARPAAGVPNMELSGMRSDFVGFEPEGKTETPVQDPKAKPSKRWASYISNIGQRLDDFALRVARVFARKFVVQCPLVYLASCIWLLGLVVGLSLRNIPIQVETAFDEFMTLDMEVNMIQDAFVAAKDARSLGRRLLLDSVFEVSLFYELSEDAVERSLLDFNALVAISRLETNIRELPGWRSFCDRVQVDDRPACQIGLSFANYALPTQEHSTSGSGTSVLNVPRSLHLDGRGGTPLPFDAAFDLIELDGMVGALLPEGYERSEPPAVLRSVFRFRLPCCGSGLPDAEALEDEWREFARTELLPLLQSPDKDWESEEKAYPLSVYFDGDLLSELQVAEVLSRDMLPAIGSLLVVFVYLLIHTQSFIHSTVGLSIVAFSVPTTYVLFVSITGLRKVNLMCLLAAYLSLGFGSDTVIVFNDMWFFAADLGLSSEDRLIYILHQGGKVTLGGSLAIAMAFFVNVFSIQRPFREFGLFMFFCVLVSWLLLTLIYAPLYLTEGLKWRRKLCNCKVRDKYREYRTELRKDWMYHLARRRWLYMALLVFSILLEIVVVSQFTTLNEDPPSLFPDGHNKNRGLEVRDLFKSADTALPPVGALPDISVQVCDVFEFNATRVGECKLFWGEKVDEGLAPAGDCLCQRAASTEYQCSLDYSVTLMHRWFGLEAISDEDLAGPIGVHIQGDDLGLGFGVPPGETRASTIRRSRMAGGHLVEWFSGGIQYVPVVQSDSVFVRTTLNSFCSFEEVCFCGTILCELSSEYPDGWLVVPTSRRLQGGASGGVVKNQEEALVVKHGTPSGRSWRSAPASGPAWRKLSGDVPNSQQVVVDVVFGITIDSSTPWFGNVDPSSAYEFSQLPDMDSHYVQRALWLFCLDMPADLMVANSSCWIQDFRTYVTEVRGQRFPTVTGFQELFEDFLQDPSAAGAEGYMWLRDGQLDAFYYSFRLDVDKDTLPISDGLEVQDAWSSFVHSASSEEGSLHCFHTSSYWVKIAHPGAFKADVFVVGTFMALFGVLISLVCLCNVALVVFTVLATGGFLLTLGTLLFVVCRLQAGPLEVAAMITFSGYALAYPLHVAQRYGDRDGHSSGEREMQEQLPKASPRRSGSMPDFTKMGMVEGCLSLANSAAPVEERWNRTDLALAAMGESIVGGALAVIGCSMFLVFCQMALFQTMGLFLASAAILSALTSLGPLPAALLSLGPESPKQDPLKCCVSPALLAGALRRLKSAAGSEKTGAAASRGTPGPHKASSLPQPATGPAAGLGPMPAAAGGGASATGRQGPTPATAASGSAAARPGPAGAAGPGSLLHAAAMPGPGQHAPTGPLTPRGPPPQGAGTIAVPSAAFDVAVDAAPAGAAPANASRRQQQQHPEPVAAPAGSAVAPPAGLRAAAGGTTAVMAGATTLEPLREEATESGSPGGVRPRAQVPRFTQLPAASSAAAQGQVHVGSSGPLGPGPALGFGQSPRVSESPLLSQRTVSTQPASSSVETVTTGVKPESPDVTSAEMEPAASRPAPAEGGASIMQQEPEQEQPQAVAAADSEPAAPAAGQGTSTQPSVYLDL